MTSLRDFMEAGDTGKTTPENTVAVTVPEIRRRFDLFNKSLFGGELPSDISFKVVSSKNAIGFFKANVVSTNGKPLEKNNLSGFMALVALPMKNYTLTDMTIGVSGYFDLTEDQFNSVIVHEMIHMSLALNGYPFVHHGPKFEEMRADLNKKTDFHITRTEDPRDLKMNDKAQAKKVYAILMYNKGSEKPRAIALASPAKMEAQRDQWQRFFKDGIMRTMKVMIYDANTTLHLTYPIRQKIERMPYYRVDDPGKVKHIVDNGKLLYDSSSDKNA